MSERSGPRPETLAAQALGWEEPATGALAPSIHPSTTYTHTADGGAGRGYTRDDNPTYDQAEALLAALEGGAGCLLFASGMAAAAAAFQTLAPGDHVVAPDGGYYGTRTWLGGHGAPWGLAVDFVPAGDIDALADAVRPDRTKLVWVETPSNPTWAITDIAAAAEIAHAAGARLAVDSTAATPVLTRPLDHGADIVMHSATKYLNGHGDVLAGALVTKSDDDAWRRLQKLRHDGGAVLGPFEAWLLLRGMRTLFLRVGASSRAAQRLAEHFQGHPRISSVLYPGLPDHPGHAAAARQMTGGFGGMLSIRVAGGAAAALEACARTKLFKRATSLGGVESLIEHRASIEGPESPVPDDLLRLSVGVEHADDLIADLEGAL